MGFVVVVEAAAAARRLTGVRWLSSGLHECGGEGLEGGVVVDLCVDGLAKNDPEEVLDDGGDVVQGEVALADPSRVRAWQGHVCVLDGHPLREDGIVVFWC